MDISTSSTLISTRLSAIRKLMKEHKVDAYIISSSDPHQSEYLADHWKQRIWISGFTGSAGTVVITHDHAGLWTDSRYFIQAESQLADCEVVLHKLTVPHTPQHISWMADNLMDGSTVACDGALFSINQVRSLAKHLSHKNITLNTDLDLISSIWQDRPGLPLDEIVEHDLFYAGKSRTEKLTSVRSAMKKYDADHYLIATLDDIAWLFNLRGSDIECNPVFIAYALVGHDVAFLYVNEAKIGDEIKAKLREEGVILRPYTSLVKTLKGLESSVLVHRSSTNIQLYNALNADLIIHAENLVEKIKSVKNDKEVEHIKNAMIKDGVALTKLFRWLEETLEERSVKETEVAKVLAGFRSEQKGYCCESFPAIVGYKGNGAIVHYRAEEETCAEIQKEGILLLDSGGQYQDGTTDITRTVALGTPTDEQKRHFTLVLKGYIALDRAYFPKGTKGVQLDILARQHLWRAGLNYGHGTGHGVGFFLDVHEGPQGFSPNALSRGSVPFEAGMLTSNEPGYYLSGEYGIRIENLILCQEAKEGFLCFEAVTLFPIDTQLIQTDLMTKEEITWLNDYHSKVYEKLSPSLNIEEQKWLEIRCRAV